LLLLSAAVVFITVLLMFRFTCCHANQWTMLRINQSTGLPIWLFWRQILKFWPFLKGLRFFWKPKIFRKNLAFLFFFNWKRLGSGKTLFELHIHYKSLLTRAGN